MEAKKMLCMANCFHDEMKSVYKMSHRVTVMRQLYLPCN